MASDLSATTRTFYKEMRHYHDVLRLQITDPLYKFQTRLRSLHAMGILNLSLATFDKSDNLQFQIAKNRSLVSRLREANKRTAIANNRARRAEEENEKSKKLLKVAESQVAAFRTEHPDWTPPDKVLLPKEQHNQCSVLFKVCIT